MRLMKLAARSGLAAARDLRAAMQGKVVERGDDSYDRARKVWNGAVDHRPALVAFCETPQDVQAAVHVARVHGIALSVRGGGHDWAGRAVRHDGLVIDLSAVRRVEVDPRAQSAAVAGGATAADLIAAAAPFGLVAVTGSVGAVGMAGLTLGGGYGPLIARHGLALDNLLGAELVLADGRCVTADTHEHPDLFWALRGGGGNFGVVTAMRLRLHALGPLLAGLILFPWGQAATSPFAAIALHHFRGAATRVPAGDTAFGMRREHMLVEIVAAWEPDDDGTAHRRWALELSRALAPHALPGGYANMLGPAAH